MNKQSENIYINDCYQLLEEFTETLIEFVKAYDQESKKIKFIPPHPPQGVDCTNWHKKSDKLNIENASSDFKRNAYYNYTFSLFEIFTIKILKTLIVSNSEVKNRYEKKWFRLIDEGFHKEFNISSEILTDIKSLYERYDIVSRYEGSSYLELIQSIIGLRKPDLDFYNKSISNFIIFKEIRNLLTHRGWIIDSIFCETLKNNGSLKKFPNHLNEFLSRVKTDDSQEDYYDEKFEFDLDHLIGSPLRIPLGAIAENLIYIAGYIVISLEVNELFERNADNNAFCLGNFLHFLLNSSKILPGVAPNLVQYLFLTKEILLVNKKDIEEIEVFNCMLAKNLIIENAEKQHRGKKCEDCIENRNNLANEISMYSDYLGKELQNLLKAYIDSDLKNFMETIEISSFKNSINEETFISQKWLKNKDFKKFLKSIK